MQTRFVKCPSCESRVSVFADRCPYCGFPLKDEHALIAINATAPAIKVSYDIENADPVFTPRYVSTEQRQAITDALLDPETAQRIAPQFFAAVKELTVKSVETITTKDVTNIPDKMFVAKFSETGKKLLKTGELVIAKDKKGNLLPQLKNADHHIKELVRLEELDYSKTSTVTTKATTISFNAAQAMNDMMLQARLADISAQLNVVLSGVLQIRQGQLNDRLAECYYARELYIQAMQADNPQLKENLLIEAATAGVKGRYLAMSTVKEIFPKFEEEASKYQGGFQLFDKSNSVRKEALAAKEAISALFQSALVESSSYMMLGEKEVAIATLKDFKGQVAYVQKNDRLELLRSWDPEQEEGDYDKLEARIQTIGTLEIGLEQYKLLENGAER